MNTERKNQTIFCSVTHVASNQVKICTRLLCFCKKKKKKRTSVRLSTNVSFLVCLIPFLFILAKEALSENYRRISTVLALVIFRNESRGTLTVVCVFRQ